MERHIKDKEKQRQTTPKSRKRTKRMKRKEIRNTDKKRCFKNLE